MQILLNNKLVEYKNNLFNNLGKISFTNGNLINIHKDVKYIVPGFIDEHIHGLKGHDTMDGTFESLNAQSLGLLEEGTTSFLATTMTANLETLNNVLDVIKENQFKVQGASILGVHLEGPFINTEKIGAQNPKNIQGLNVENFKKLNHLDIIKMVTYAPELDNDYSFTKFLSSNNIVPSVGHSNATCEEVIEAQKHGLRCFTHLHNASSGYANRNPGVVTAAYVLKDPFKELIVDGIHVDPFTIKSVYQNIGADKINLITDSMRAKLLDDGIYDLGGLEVEKKGDRAVLAGTESLAGSVLKMNDAIRNMINLSNCSVEEAFKMASFNQAKLLGLNNVGLIKENYEFDITCLDENFNVLQVFKNGEELYDKFNN